jgi:hypothetical protein
MTIKTVDYQVLLSLLFIIFYGVNPAFSATAEGDWECVVRDTTNKEWVGKSNYQRSAMNHAFESCKKESQHPSTCKTPNDYCNALTNGLSTRPMWRCSAYDSKAKSWRGTIYPERDEAALAAKAYCQDQSDCPDSCYINLLTCKNINLRD